MLYTDADRASRRPVPGPRLPDRLVPRTTDATGTAAAPPAADLALTTGHTLRLMPTPRGPVDHRAVLVSQQRLWAALGVPGVAAPAVPAPRSGTGTHLYLLGDAAGVLVGCVHLVPATGSDPAEASWWLADHQAGSDLDQQLDAAVRRWVTAAWPAVAVRFAGRDARWGLLLTEPLVDRRHLPAPAGDRPAPHPAAGHALEDAEAARRAAALEAARLRRLLAARRWNRRAELATRRAARASSSLR
ncbi:hypothetical protein GB931_14230 [Modestobacter sp. I12A-02628]|uniref:Uncharacterized protein n=1 Tax=Goekera deserti TaxID=2497753 RepID=A0A7K3WHT2_9ACTN|nr:hypothetical protein [Goekera deserti]MPQ99058.1 hypothetical protein [Goekera deserti]NDI47392.1 hypothetical protein [Goekera deserti]NEL55922.1 hypothetical protein [Goekera deserti]